MQGIATMAVGVVVVAALYLGRDIFIPLVLAILLSFVLAPVTSFFRRLRLGRIPSVIVAVLLALGVILAIGTVIGAQIADLAGNASQYRTTVERKIAGLQEGILGRANVIVRTLDHGVGGLATGPGKAAPGDAPATQTGTPGTEPMLVRVQEQDSSPVTLARKILGPVVEPLATVGIVVVVVIFLLMQREDLRNRLIRLFGSSDLHRTTMAMDDAAKRLSRYFLVQLGLNAAFGIIIGVGLWLIGVPSPVLWGVFSALMRFVPYVGAFISGILPVALAAAVDPGWSMVLAAAALFLVAEPLVGQVAEPLLYGQSTGLSPFAVIISTLFWTFLWGPIGLILATPFTVCLVVLGKHVERLEFLNVLLGDQPPLTPVENFYQRILAGDPDEAVELGEQMLRERSLSSYYDEVALKGLQLAANDYARGVIPHQQLEDIKLAAQALVEDFEKRPDEDPSKPEAATADPTAASDGTAMPGWAPPASELPPAWRGERPVL
jgi:predicted PurR-regulated permease PerM